MLSTSRSVDLAEEVKHFALDKGADLVGIAPISRFANAPDQHHPRFFLPKAQSVVAIALRINEAILRTVAKRKEHYSYCAFGFKFVNDELDAIAYQLAKHIERLGFDAYPIPANAPRDPMFRWGLSHRHAAVAAGLGQPGWNLNLLTPRFGARQKLVSVITDAPLEPDPLCEERVCDDCYACVKICPTGALPVDKAAGFEIDGMSFRHSRQTKWKCAFGCGGLTDQGTFAMTKLPLPKERPSSDEMFQYLLEQKEPMQQFLEQELCNVPWCARCLAVCSLHLDAKRRFE